MKSKSKNLPKKITIDERKKYENELQHLKQFTRKEISKKIRDIRLKGNLSESIEYDDAKDEQREIERKISNLEAILKKAEVIDDSFIPEDVIMLGSKVLLRDIEYDEDITYCIVESSEVNSLKNKISDESPLGKVLLGKRAGDRVKVTTGAGTIEYEVLEIQGILESYKKKLVEQYEKKQSQTVSGVSSNHAPVKDISIKDFVTRVNVFKCTSQHHKLMDIRCRIKILKTNGKIENCIVPGAFCETCNKYYLLESEFQQLRTKGVLLCKVVESDYWTGNGTKNEFSNLNDESLLHLVGYNVNAKMDLSENQRHVILEMLVDEKVLTITEIRSHLQWLIRRNSNNRNFDDARIKWKKDSDYMATYEAEEKDIVEIKSIHKKNYH